MRFSRTYTALTVWRVVLLYVVMMLCRAIFVCYNIASFGTFAWSEIPALIAGALQFDTVSIVYADGLWLVLSLLPFRFRERKRYREMLYWYYVIVNSAVVAVNLGDAVYFRYTQKRFTSEEIFFADNSNSAALVLKFAAENWYLVIAGIALIALLAWGYRRRAEIVHIADRAVYYSVNAVTLLLAVTLAVGGVRGGFSRMTRPIAIPNSMGYVSSAVKANIVLSNPFCILRTAGSGSNGRTVFFAEEELAEIYTPCHYPPLDNRTSLCFKAVISSFS